MEAKAVKNASSLLHFSGQRDLESGLLSYCDPFLSPSMNFRCCLSLLWVLSFAPRGFYPGTPVFPSNSSKFQFDLERLETLKPGVLKNT